jgi:ubiquinone biosynthesis protein COQ4
MGDKDKNPAKDHAVIDFDYLQMGAKPLTTESSILVSSSRFLDDAVLRDLHAQSAFAKNGSDIPVTYLSVEYYKAYLKVRDYAAEEAAIAAHKKADAKFAAWLDARFLANYKADAVAHCKPGTLGAMIHDFLVKSGMSMDFLYNGQDIKSDLVYFETRINQSHDIEHMVMGFDVNFGGEIALDMFRLAHDSRFLPDELAQIRNRSMGYAMSTAMMKTALHYPPMMYQFMDCTRIGVEAANRINRDILFLKWEDYYDMALPEVRKALNIIAPEPNAWDWTDEAYGLPPLPPKAKAAD